MRVLEERGFDDPNMGAQVIEAEIVHGAGMVAVAQMIDLSLLKAAVDSNEAVRAVRGHHDGQERAKEVRARADQVATRVVDPDENQSDLPEDERVTPDNPHGQWRPRYDRIDERVTEAGYTEMVVPRVR